MNKILISSATFEHERLLQYSGPTFERFADAQGYDLLIDRGTPAELRTGSYDYKKARWRKIELIQEALHSHEIVLWMDSDVMVTRYDKDILDDLPADCFQGMVMEYRNDHFFPNTGVWLLRGGSETGRFMDAVLKTGLLKHTFADQPAVWKALGWSLGGYKGKGAKPVRHSTFLAHTAWLPTEWNPVGLGGRLPARTHHFMGLSVDERCKRMARLQRELQQDPGDPERNRQKDVLSTLLDLSSSAPA